jgi:Leucine-rich repeat (LRR) protein
MKVVQFIITIGLIALVKAQTPTCNFPQSSDGLLTCQLLDGTVNPENINTKIEGNPGAGKTFNDVERLYSTQPVTTEMIYTIFINFVNLKKLELTNGIVELIAEDMFKANCTKLEKLIINGGKIKTVNGNAFTGCPELTEIDLGQNAISGIVSGAFSGLSKLKILKFSSNQLLTISTSVFNIPTLESLDLSKNKLTLTNNSIFLNTKELLSLNLAENLNSILTKDQFKGLEKLTDLDFTKNGLNATEGSALEHLKELKVAKFGGNICIDKDYTDYNPSNFAADFDTCIRNYNGAPILILSNLALVASIMLKFVY